MKVFYLRIPSSDFVRSGNTWTSNVIDLYYNDYYKNYSVTKSNYGLNLLNDGTWTGIDKLSATLTDSGIVIDNRFVDTTGQINLTNFTIDLSSTASAVYWNSTTFYFSDNSTHSFPSEWIAPVDPIIGDTADLGFEDTDRYMRVKIDTSFESVDSTYDFDFYLRVEIDNPVIAPLYEKTRSVVQRFPQWMDIGEWDTPVGSRPVSVGAKLINAIAGEWLEDLNSELIYNDLQRFIDTADTNQLDWAHKAQQTPQFVYSIVGDDVPLAFVDKEGFYDSLQTEDVAYWDEVTATVYCRKSYNELKINGISYDQAPHHVWNSFDEIGLSVDLPRIHLENNSIYKLRILDVYKNKPGVGVESFKYALRRELDLWRFMDGATPDSEYIGATPYILEMADLEQDAEWWDEEGIPTDKFLALADYLSRQFPNTWGRFRWDEMRWDLGGFRHESFGLLPYRLDSTPMLDTQSGVGDIDDLRLFRPDAHTGPITYSAFIRGRGRQRSIVREYRAVEFDIFVSGTADKKIYDNPTVQEWFTVEANIDGVMHYHSFPLSSTSDIDVDQPESTPASFTHYQIFDEDDRILVDFRDKVTDALYTASDDASSINELTLVYGRWNTGSQAYVSRSGTDRFNAWFAYDDDTTVVYNSHLTGAVTPKVVHGDTYFNDEFTGTSLQNPWTIVSGGFSMLDGELLAGDTDNPTGTALAIIPSEPTGVIDIEYGDTVRPIGIVFRYVDNEHYWFVTPTSASNTSWQIGYTAPSGNVTTLFTAAKPAGSQLRVIAAIDEIRVYVNSVLVHRESSQVYNFGTSCGITATESSANDGPAIASFNLSGSNWSDIVMSSKASSYAVGRWESEQVIYHVSVNGILPDQSASIASVRVPDIAWDNYLESTPNKRIAVQIATTDGSQPGAFVVKPDGTLLFLPSGFIFLNASNAWTLESNGSVQEIDASATTLYFYTYALFDDPFDRADGDPENGWEPVGSSVWAISSESLQNDSASAGIITHSGIQDGHLTVTIGDSIADTIGILFRYDDLHTHWLLETSGVRWLLKRITPTGSQTVSSISTAPMANQEISIRFEGDSIDIWIDDDLVLEYVDPLWDQDLLRAGSKIGLYATNSTPFDRVTFSPVVDYPVSVEHWEPFTTGSYSAVELGTIDENGPWVNGTPPEVGNTNFAAVSFDLNRGLLSIPQDPDYRVTDLECYIGDTDNPELIIGWLDSTRVNPYDDDESTYIDSALPETKNDDDEYVIGPVLFSARLRSDPMPEWKPKLNSGYFYERGFEYYNYADKEVETHATPLLEKILNKPVRQGAPVVVQKNGATPSWTQVAFYVEDDDGVQLSTTNTQRIIGNGTAHFYVAYKNIYNIQVIDLETDQTVDLIDTSSVTNRVSLVNSSVRDRLYEVTYKVRNSFVVDNDFEYNGNLKSKIIFDATPIGGDYYSVTYESSSFNTASDASVELSPLYSSLDEGFVFISHQEYTFDKVIIKVDPPKILADGQDYMLVSMSSVDKYGNPKPNQSFILNTNWGSFSSQNTQRSIELTSDKDGYSSVLLYSDNGALSSLGTLTISTSDALVETVLKKAMLGVSMGESNEFTPTVFEEDLALAKAFSDWYRFTVGWDGVEASQGVYDFSDHDTIIEYALDAGYTNILATVGYSPSWANGGHSYGTDGDFGNKYFPEPSFYDDWYDYVYETVMRYKPGGSYGYADEETGVTVWEIWNEPNFPYFGRKHGTSPASSSVSVYAKIFSLAAEAVRAADPNAIVLPGGAATCETNSPNGSNRYNRTYNASLGKQWSMYDWYHNLLFNTDNILSSEPTIGGLVDGLAAHCYWSNKSPIFDETSLFGIDAQNYNPFLWAPIYLYDMAIAAGIPPEKAKVWSTEGGQQSIGYWEDGEAYAANQRVYLTPGQPSADGASWLRSTRYKCISSHTATALNAPPNTTYWAVDPDNSSNPDYQTLSYAREPDEMGFHITQALDYWFSPALKDRVELFIVYNMRDVGSAASWPGEHFGLRLKATTLHPEGRVKGSGPFAMNGPWAKLAARAAEPDPRQEASYPVLGTMGFEITPSVRRGFRVTAIPSVDQIQADGTSQIIIYGKVEGPDFSPVPDARVHWIKGRSIQELFDTTQNPTSGVVISESDGSFIIGPFTAAAPTDPGYWFVAVYTEPMTIELVAGVGKYGSGKYGSGRYGNSSESEFVTFDSAGDVIFWQEYPMQQYGIENVSGVPISPVQYRTPDSATPYSDNPFFPAAYDELNPFIDATPSNITWIPPKWFAMSYYEQYQLGIFGRTRNEVDSAQWNNIHPPKREL